MEGEDPWQENRTHRNMTEGGKNRRRGASSRTLGSQCLSSGVNTREEKKDNNNGVARGKREEEEE